MKRYQVNIRKVTPYVPGEQPNFPDMIKLNTNENPYPPAPAVQAAVSQSDASLMRLYPDPTAHPLNAAIAKAYGVEESQVFTGVGSDDVLAMIFQTFFNSDLPVLFPDITYAFYPVWCDLFKIPYETKPLNEALEIVPEDYFQENGGIVFPNPNAPTGIAMPLSEIERILRHNPESLVVVDEAYVDFGGQSVLPLLEQYENLLVVQTFSKSRSMAGARIGFAIGSKELIAALHDVKYSFNSYTMNRPSIAAGVASVQDTAYLAKTTGKIIATRERTKEVLSGLGFHFPDSKSNFLFVTHPDLDAHKLFLALREAHIFVRWFDADRVREYLRITIGTDEEMDKLFAFLKEYMGK
jgi:histidinol-phosphate aminotransferase